MRVAVVFPGQGTQTPGMGAPWRDGPAWKVLEDAQAAAGESLADLVLDAGAAQLGRTRAAQLAVLATSLVAWNAVASVIDTPVAFAGHSLGQVTALIAAGVVDVDMGVRFAAARADLTQAAADAQPGRMAALLGASFEQGQAVCADAPDECWIANDNAPGQIVVAGTPGGIERAVANAKAHGVRRATMLDVGGAFHTPLMASARDGLAAVVADVPLHAPSAPVVSNHDARAYSDGEGWRDRLPQHVTVPVRWRESMVTLRDLGVDAFVEVGHGTMIAGVAKRTVPEVAVLPCATPADVETLADRIGDALA